MNNQICAVITVATISINPSNIGTDTLNYDFGCLAEANLKSGKEELVEATREAYRYLGICKGSRVLKIEDFNGLIDFVSKDEILGTQVFRLNTNEEALKSIKSLIEEADINNSQNLMVVAHVCQVLGRYTQEYGIDSYKTFLKPFEIFSEKTLKGLRSSMKENKEISFNWDEKQCHLSVKDNGSNAKEEPFYMRSEMSDCRDLAIKIAADFALEMVGKIQRMDKVRAYLQSGKISFKDTTLESIRWMQQDYMTISYAGRQYKSNLAKNMKDNLDKVAREHCRAKFDPYYMGQRNLLRHILKDTGIEGKDAALAALQVACENVDSRNKLIDQEARKNSQEVKDHKQESEMTSGLVEKLLKEEYSLLTISSEHIAKEKLMMCDIPEGTKVSFKDNYAIFKGTMAYGVIPDGEYVITKENNNFFAVKNVRAHMEETLQEQNNCEDITIRVKELLYPLDIILKKGIQKGIELKDFNIDRFHGRIYDAIVIDGITVAKFDRPYDKTWNVDQKKEVAKAFLGKWNIKCGDTFICSNGKTKDFLVLSK